MAKDDGMGEKTEEATPKRREEAREKGQVAKSQDLTGALVMLIGFAFLKIMGVWYGTELLAHVRFPFAQMHEIPSSPDQMLPRIPETLIDLLVILTPFLAMLFVIGAAVTAMQVGIKPSPKAFEFNPEKMNPISGVQKLFSMRSLMKLLTGVAKIVIVGGVLYVLLSSELPTVLNFISTWDYRNNNTEKIVIYLADMILWLGIYAGATLTIIGIIDYSYQKWQHNEDLKMSKQEVKEEMKNMEGDPQIKRKRREIARQVAMSRMMDDVGEADVVVTNPTHYSIALKYRDPEPAPRLVAKGTDRMALKIREIASENKVPIVEKPELARALYRWVNIDELVPAEYWDAVAEVLAYVYSMDEKRKRQALGDEVMNEN